MIPPGTPLVPRIMSMIRSDLDAVPIFLLRHIENTDRLSNGISLLYHKYRNKLCFTEYKLCIGFKSVVQGRAGLAPSSSSSSSSSVVPLAAPPRRASSRLPAAAAVRRRSSGDSDEDEMSFDSAESGEESSGSGGSSSYYDEEEEEEDSDDDRY